MRRDAIGLPVDVHVNAPGTVVEHLLGEASLYWHGAGLGEDPSRHPERFEHFGISVVEAMAAGAVPLVFGAAGPAEIVRDGVDGIHWTTLDELADATVQLVADTDASRCAVGVGHRTAPELLRRRVRRSARQFVSDDTSIACR